MHCESSPNFADLHDVGCAVAEVNSPTRLSSQWAPFGAAEDVIGPTLSPINSGSLSLISLQYHPCQPPDASNTLEGPSDFLKPFSYGTKRADYRSVPLTMLLHLSLHSFLVIPLRAFALIREDGS